MADTGTLSGLTAEMEELNRSNYEIERHTRNARGHLLEMKKVSFLQLSEASDTSLAIKNLVNILTGNALAQLEKDREMMKMFKGMGTGGGAPGAAEPEDFIGPQGGAVELGLALGAVALAIGGGLGLIQGQIKAIKAYTTLLKPKAFTTMIEGMKTSWTTRIESLKTGIRSRIAGLAMNLELLLDDLKLKFAINPESKLGRAIAKISGIGTNIGLMMDKIKAKFIILPDSKLGTVISKISTTFDDFAKSVKSILAPIIGAGETVKTKILGAASRVGFWFKSIGAKVSRFGGIVTKIAGIVGKVFAPIAIVVTAWETITGFIEGWKEDGILGGLEGAITGFFTSLITIPLDLVKDAVAWVLGKLGFDKESEALKSFSFTALFKKMIGAVFDVIKGAIDWVKLLFTDPVGAIKKLWTGLYGEDGIINTIVWKPISKVINWVMEKFGWKDDDPNAPDFDLFTFITDIWNTIVTKVKKGFIDFGNWIASIPARIKLVALETIKKTPLVGNRLVGDDDIAAARAGVESYSVSPGLAATGDVLGAAQKDVLDATLANQGGNGAGTGGGNDVTLNDTKSITVLEQKPSASGTTTGHANDKTKLSWQGYGPPNLQHYY